MRKLLLNGVTALLVVVLMALPAAAAQEVDWTSTTPASGEVVGEELLLQGPGTHHLVTVDNLETSGDSYEVAGSVRFEGVEGAAYLEMWSYFADGSSFYSRTLASEGPMAVLRGDSEGRRFELPFFLNGAEGPERLEINLVMPADGRVWISPLELVGFGGSTYWWSETQAGLVGATGGILAGLSGAMLGYLVSRRKSRRLVEGVLVVGAVVGVVLLVVAAVAWLTQQPQHVWYPLALIGGILALVYGALIPTTRRNYQAAELSRMRALDA